MNLRHTILLTTINAKWIHPSLALRLLKANLGPLEVQAEIREFALHQPLPEKVEPVLAAHPRILGISVSIWNHTATVELLRALTAIWDAGTVPKPVIILGGPEVSHVPMEGELAGYADWIVRGEGEAVFRELCAFLLERDGGGVPAEKAGETAAESGRIRNVGPIAASSSSSEQIALLPSVKAVSGKLIEARTVDLSAINSGYRLYTEEDLSRKLVYVEASRGCPFGCEFCLSFLDRQVREFPLDGFLGDMAALLERGARSFKFLDRTFNLDIARARTIMEFFLERIGEASQPGTAPEAETPIGNTRPPLYVHFEMVPMQFPPELRETLTRFPPGSLRLEVGIQTFNRSTADLIGRPGNPDQELETLDFLWRSTNAIVHVDLIAALPGEDLDSFGAGFDRLWQTRPAAGTRPTPFPAAQPTGEIQLGILKLLPGTPIARHGKRYGMRYAPDPPYEALETAALPAGSLDRVKNFARFWELIVNRSAFPDLTSALFPEGQPVFRRFMAMADWLLARFGRNWGIDRRDLRAAVEEYYSSFSK
ncbi:hypothetical protein FACS189483_01090 [Spirochaetia bacterium]|nr:hypothetical protein FACS189483_01090 [Spirochaetia bacterium]